MKKYTITIARGYGSGGKTIGFMLADALGIECYHKAILKKASDESGINHTLFAQSDEKAKKSLFDVFKNKKYKGELIPPSSDNFVSEQNLFNYQSKVISDLAKKESCIFIGRCADYVLKDCENVLRIYINAPYEDCIRNAMDRDKIDRAEAQKRIKHLDKQRSDYYKQYTGKNWADASNYDICINTKELSFWQSVEIIKKVIEMRFAD